MRPNVVLDTNVLLVAIPSASQFRSIFDAFLDGKFQLLISTEILAEYEEVFIRQANSVVAQSVLELLVISNNVSRIDPHFQWSLIQADFDDNKFVDCAINGNADYLVTNDRHFSILNEIEFPKVNTIKAEQFIQILNQL